MFCWKYHFNISVSQVAAAVILQYYINKGSCQKLSEWGMPIVRMKVWIWSGALDGFKNGLKNSLNFGRILSWNSSLPYCPYFRSVFHMCWYESSIQRLHPTVENFSLIQMAFLLMSGCSCPGKGYAGLTSRVRRIWVWPIMIHYPSRYFWGYSRSYQYIVCLFRYIVIDIGQIYRQTNISV